VSANCGLSDISLTLLQVPSFSDISLHKCDRIRTVRVQRKSQIAQRRNLHGLSGRGHQAISKIHLPTRGQGLYLVFAMYSEHLGSYRPSSQYDVPTLKTLALNHIRSELTKCDIVEEAFGRFASRLAWYIIRMTIR